MDTVKVKKSELLNILYENRKKHKTEYKEAIRSYRVKAADLLTRELQKITAGKKFETSFDLYKPTSHEKDYDLIIKMIEMSVDDIIELRNGEFNQLVNDEWNWRTSFDHSRTSNSGYYSYSNGISGSSGRSGTSGMAGSSGNSYIKSTSLPNYTDAGEVSGYTEIKFADDEDL